MATGTITLTYEYGLSNGQTDLFDMGAYSIPSGGTYSRHKITCDKTSSADWPVSWGNEYNFNQYYWGNWYSDENKLKHGSYPGHAVIWVKNQSGSFGNIKVTLTIEYTYTDSYSITVSAGTGGSASASANSASPGATVTITSTPNSGYSANTPTASGISFTSLGNNKWTFTMPSSAVTVSCTFSKINYTVTTASSPAAGGTLTSNKSTAQVGDTVQLTRTASSGYQFSSWTKTPSNLAIGNDLKFTMPAQNVSITANWTKINYSITVNAGTGGTASSNKSTAQIGDTVTITCIPGTGYTANTPTASGISFSAAGANKWTFTMPSSNVTISCTFSNNGYTITKAANPSGGGTITTSKTTANYGDTITISQTPAAGYYFNGWTISPNITITNNSFTMPASNVTITANYLKRSTATLSSSNMTGGGTVTLNIVPEKASYSHKYKLSFGTNMETSLTTVAAGTTSVNISVPLNWSAQIPSATSKGSGALLLETYNGSTLIGEYTITGLTYNVPASVVPSIGTITTSIVRTIGQTTYANIGEIYTQGKCGVRIQASGSGNQGSTVSSMEVSISGYTDAAHRTTVSGSSVDFTSGLLTVSGTATITVKAIDSRGRVATKTANISVTAYNRPNGTLTVWRVDSAGDRDLFGDYGKYELSKAYTAIGTNTLSWSIKSQNVTYNSPDATGDLLPNSRQTFNQVTEYPIELTLVDAFETVSVIVMLQSAQFMIFLNADGDRMAFMKATNENLSKNGKDGTIEFSANHQIYIGTTTLEDYIRGVINGTIS